MFQRFKKADEPVFAEEERYIVITKNRVVIEETLQRANAALNSELQIEEFQRIGNIFLINLDEIDLDFVRDKRKMSAIFASRLHRKPDTKSNIALGIILLMCFINMVK